MITIVKGGRVATCDSEDRVFEGDIVIEDGAIRALGPGAADGIVADHVIDATDHAVIPGLVQAHVHLVQALFRGLADDVPLLTWLERFIWPLEAAHDDASLKVSAELGLAELLLSGTTAILDMGTVHGHDVVFDACARSGIRATSGKTMMDQGDRVPARLRETRQDSVRESERLRAFWQGKEQGKLAYAFAPRFILSCSEGLIRDAAEAANHSGALIHTHAAEHADERKAVRDALGDEDIAILARLGVTGPRAVLAHGVQVDDAEIAGLSAAKTKIVHCPSANLKLGSGIARVDALRRAGVVVGLGGDGAPCNNNLDPWVEMRHAALLAKVRSGTTTLPAREVLRMATIDGAKVLGRDDHIGSLEVGKRADLVVVRLSGIHVAPAHDLFSTLVYACQSRDVAHVMIDGKQIVADGELKTLDASKIARSARTESRRIAALAGLLVNTFCVDDSGPGGDLVGCGAYAIDRHS